MDRLWAMQVFVHVVECGSFTRAAEALDLANATVTSSVRNLEKHLGVTLIQRNTRFLNLTDEGQSYYESCLELLRDVETAEASVRGKGGAISGVLRVEAPFAFGKALLCPLIARFTTRHPELSVAMILTDHPQNLIERGTDVAIRMDHVDDVGLVARPIYEAHYVLCGSPGLMKQMKMPGTPAELDPRRCLGLLGGGQFVANPWQFSFNSELHELAPSGPVSYNSSDALIQAALQDEGLIYVLDVFVNKLLASGALMEVLPDWTTATRRFYAVTAKNRFVAPKVRAFLEFLQQSLDAQKRPSPALPIAVRGGKSKRASAKTRPR